MEDQPKSLPTTDDVTKWLTEHGDLFALAEDVMLHRMRLNYEALAEGLTGTGVLQEMLHELGAR